MQGHWAVVLPLTVALFVGARASAAPVILSGGEAFNDGSSYVVGGSGFGPGNRGYD